VSTSGDAARRTPPQWTNAGEALRVWFARSTLRRTLTIAAIVGTLLSLINQGSVLFGGDATVATWVRIAMNYVVPFCVSSIGFPSATRAGAAE
jgi:hypothetical protein